MKKSNLEIVRRLSKNLLSYLLSIPTKERSEYFELLDSIESLLQQLIEQIDNKINDETDWSEVFKDVDWSKEIDRINKMGL